MRSDSLLCSKIQKRALSSFSIWVGVIACWGSVLPWPMWKSEYFPFFLLMLFTATRAIFWNENYTWATVVSMVATIAFAFVYSQLFTNGLIASIYQVVYAIVPIVAFLTLQEHERYVFLKRFINFFSVIALASVIAFFAHFFIDLPYFIIHHTNSFYAPFKNYIFFVITQNSDFGWFTRFSSVYSEPGHMSMVCAILLYINGYSFRKWQNIIMTICLIWTFSLAGYLLFLGGIILHVVAKSKKILLTLSKIISVTIILLTLGFIYYSPQNNDMFSIKILSRLEFDENNGIAGNNRNSIWFNQYYDEFLSSQDKWLGIGRGELGKRFGGTGNASYKNYVLGNGVIGTIAIFFLMGTYLFCYPSRKGLGLMILLSISFIQRPYFLWAIECFPYVAALSTWYIHDDYQKQNIIIAKQSTILA